jgi:hypothetical protein
MKKLLTFILINIALFFLQCKDSANRMQLSSLVIAEVQPVLVFEDKVRAFFMRKQENSRFLHRLVTTGARFRDIMQITHKIVSQKLSCTRLLTHSTGSG